MASQQGIITITGRIGSEPAQFGEEPRNGVQFRLGCTPGYMDANHEWRKLPTTWITIKAFRTLALNAFNSLHKGDPVLISGRLVTEEWTTNAGELRSRVAIEASVIGLDLNYGICTYRKMPRDPRPADQAPEVPPEAGPQFIAPEPQFAAAAPQFAAPAPQFVAPEPDPASGAGQQQSPANQGLQGDGEFAADPF